MTLTDLLFTKKYLVFVTLFLTLQYTSCTTYWKAYINAVNKISKTSYNLSVFPNAYINLLIWSVAYVILGAVLYYFYRQGNDAIMPMLVLIFVMYGCWAAFPIGVIQNGYKYAHLWLYDTMITGVLLMFITLYLFKNYYDLLEKNYILLIITCIMSYLIFFYQWFAMNRTGADNWLVRLGDNLHLDKYANSIRIFSS